MGDPHPPYFNHFGDLVYDAFFPVGWSFGGPVSLGSGNVYVSMNMAGPTNGSVGVISGDLKTAIGYAVLYPTDQVAWVAVDSRTREVYTSNSSGIIDRWNIALVPTQPLPTFVPVTGVASNGAQATSLGNIIPLNVNGSQPWGNIDIQGAKVSSHGKLWLWTSANGGTLLGLDPYSGMIQCSYPFPTGYTEVEGLDITEPAENVSSPNVGGSIHLQHLSDGGINGTWQMVNLIVSDPARL